MTGVLALLALLFVLGYGLGYATTIHLNARNKILAESLAMDLLNAQLENRKLKALIEEYTTPP